MSKKPAIRQNEPFGYICRSHHGDQNNPHIGSGRTPADAYSDWAMCNALYRSSLPNGNDFDKASNWRYQQMRSAQNVAGHLFIADVRGAKNVNLHASKLEDLSDVVDRIKGKGYEPGMFNDFGREFGKHVLRQAAYFLLLMLAIGVGLAVFL